MRSIAHTGYPEECFSYHFTHDLPIPDCFNELVAQAEKAGASDVWFVEEDNVPKRDTLEKMITAIAELETDVAACDYPISSAQQVTHYAKDGSILFTGMGCILIPMAVLDKVGPFRSDVCYSIEDGELVHQPEWIRGYGGQDVFFNVRLREEGFMIKIVDEIQHLRVNGYGGKNTNKGWHDITPIVKA